MANLKDLYSEAFYDSFAKQLAAVLPTLRPAGFRKMIFTPEFSGYELKRRMSHTAEVMHHYMPARFADAAPVLRKLVKALRAAGTRDQSFLYMFLAEYVAMYGLEDPDTAIPLMEFLTQFTSCEFAVRPFILRYEKRMLAQMRAWAEHESEHVRRLASEGSRPRLPWAMAIPAFKKDPGKTLPILEKLKNDASAYVRRSVANHLNDISKDHPAVVVQLARRWKGMSANTDAIVRHACRSLLKAGHPEILSLYGLNSRGIELSGFRLHTARLPLGGELAFSFTLRNSTGKSMPVRLEYKLYFRKKNGQLSPKVFHIGERQYAAAQQVTVSRKHSFKTISTRVYHAGEQAVAIVVNGREYERKTFRLMQAGG